MIIDDCIEIEKPSDADVNRFLNHKSLYDLNSKSSVACIFEKFGVVSCHLIIKKILIDQKNHNCLIIKENLYFQFRLRIVQYKLMHLRQPFWMNIMEEKQK